MQSYFDLLEGKNKIIVKGTNYTTAMTREGE